MRIILIISDLKSERLVDIFDNYGHININNFLRAVGHYDIRSKHEKKRNSVEIYGRELHVKYAVSS